MRNSWYSIWDIFCTWQYLSMCCIVSWPKYYNQFTKSCMAYDWLWEFENQTICLQLTIDTYWHDINSIIIHNHYKKLMISSALRSGPVRFLHLFCRIETGLVLEVSRTQKNQTGTGKNRWKPVWTGPGINVLKHNLNKKKFANVCKNWL